MVQGLCAPSFLSTMLAAVECYGNGTFTKGVCSHVTLVAAFPSLMSCSALILCFSFIALCSTTTSSYSLYCGRGHMYNGSGHMHTLYMGSGHMYAWDTICMGVRMGVVTYMHGTLYAWEYAWEWSHVCMGHCM